MDGQPPRNGGPISALTLPPPPSANQLHTPIAAGRMVKSPAYRRWINSCSQASLLPLLRLERGAPAWVEIHAGIDRRRDLDNTVKPVCDLLQVLHAIPDDRYIDRVTATRAPEVLGLRVTWGELKMKRPAGTTDRFENPQKDRSGYGNYNTESC